MTQNRCTGWESYHEETSLAKLIELKDSYDLCNIWRVRNKKSRQCTFTEQYSSGFIPRRLDYIFISNALQEVLTKTEILAPISSDHCSCLFQKEMTVSEVKDSGNSIAP